MNFTHDNQPKIVRRNSKFMVWATSFAAAFGPMAPVPAFAQDARQERVTADSVYRAMPGNPLPLHRLGENPVVRDGGVLSLNEVHRTRELFAPQMHDWAENDFENALRLINGYRPGGDATSDAALITRIREQLARTPRVGGRTQEVDITDLLVSNGYEVGRGVQVSLEAVSVGASQVYVAGTQADGPDGVKLIPLTGRDGVVHDGLVVQGDGNSADEGIRIRISRMVNRQGQYVVQTEAVDMADLCSNGFLQPYMERGLPAPEAVQSPCVQVEIVPPAGVDFDDRTVSARLVVVDTKNPLLMAPQQCVTRQVRQNCDTICQDHLLAAAAAGSEGFRALVERNRREHATLIYQDDAQLVRMDNGHFMLRLPLEVAQMNDDQAYIVCFDWDNGGSSVDVVYNPRVRRGNAEGVLTDTLSMARGGNMDVFEGDRTEYEAGRTVYHSGGRVVRGTDH